MNRLIKKSEITIKDSKSQDFSTAVADYLSKGLTEKGLNCTKKNALVDVKLDKLYLNKYSSVIIDCIEGNMYLRGKNCKDKKWGKLRRFEGQRLADAFHCARQSITRVYNRIKSLLSEEKEVYANDAVKRKDARRLIGIIKEGKLIARRFDLRSKIIFDARK